MIGYGASNTDGLSITQSGSNTLINTSVSSAVQELIVLDSVTASSLNNNDFLFF
jgi:hypothetical protein